VEPPLPADQGSVGSSKLGVVADVSFVVVVVVVVLVALAAIAGLVAIALGRLSTLVAARDGAVREAAELRTRLDVLSAQSADFERDVRQDLAHARSEQAGAAQTARTELGATLARFGDQLNQLTQSNERRLEAVRATVEAKLEALRTDNMQKLEQMRATVDEKLQTTLEKRLGDSFQLVSDRLEQVHKGLGEMQTLATGVGDLKRVLTNVKTRGTWGETQLGMLLAEVLTPQQFEANVETVPGSNKRVEFAIRLPGRGDEGSPCWLPVDAKFPLEHWQRLQDALDQADAAAADAARKALADFLRLQARTIRDSYVAPPHTTDFAILFVPTEGLYAEMMSRPGFADQLQREFRVTLTGPTNFLALLNSLQMGFRTLAIEQRSSEVWKTLALVKTEFAKFADVLAGIKKKLDEAGSSIEKAGVRTRAITRTLREVEALPDEEADRLLVTDATGNLFEGEPSEASSEPGSG
jgi:DNA recombination protein RmuC